MKIFIAGLLFILCTGTCLAETRDAEQYFFDLKMGDFKSELANARKEGKSGIMIMFEQADCPFCYRMEHTILNQSEVQDYYHRHFLLFTVDIRGSLPMEDFKGNETTEKAFSLEHRVYGTPVFDFFGTDGNLITRFPGTALDVNEFMLLGKCVAEGACKSMSFSAYKRQQAK
ncbi:MAG: thioredoxin family protein [Gallionella sp.]